MYNEYWRLKEKPFQNTPDPRFFYRSPQHEEALARLTYAVNEELGAAMLSGTFGCGKTVVGEILKGKLNHGRYAIAYIDNPRMSYPDLLRSIVRHLKSIELPQKITEISIDYLLEVLGKTFVNNSKDGKETVVVIDEAHSIKEEEVFDGLRMLLNFHSQDKFYLTLLLLGQPELKEKVSNIKQFEQRIAVKCSLDALNEKETREYISHRLKTAGQERMLFTAEALSLIYLYSAGIPRRINQICNISLLAGFSKGETVVDSKIVEEETKSVGEA